MIYEAETLDVECHTNGRQTFISKQKAKKHLKKYAKNFKGTGEDLMLGILWGGDDAMECHDRLVKKSNGDLEWIGTEVIWQPVGVIE